MPTYYEVLKLEPSASVKAIETAIDDLYDQYRRLVNHHDPEVVEQANRALRHLEDIRLTLTNPEKRAIYDQSLSFGGLADPAALLQAAGAGAGITTPPAVKSAARDSDAEEKPWRCGNCGKVNREGSKRCSNCQNVLARDCPNGCGGVVLIDERYCSNCGVNVEDALGKLQIEFERAQQAFVEEMRAKIQAKRSELDRLLYFSNNPPLLLFSANSELEQLVGQPVAATMGCNAIAVVMMAGIVMAFIGGLIDRTGSVALLLFFVGMGIGFWFIQWRAQERVQETIRTAASQRQEYIRYAEQRLQRELDKQFNPMAPKRYSPD